MNPIIRNPVQTVQRLISALNAGDLDAAVACYAPDATFIPQPGTVVTGQAAIQAALAGLLELKPTLSSARQIVFESADTALYCAEWSLSATAPDGSPVQQSGKSSDVLRRQADGSWLIVIDNPFGTGLLAPAG